MVTYATFDAKITSGTCCAATKGGHLEGAALHVAAVVLDGDQVVPGDGGGVGHLVPRAHLLALHVHLGRAVDGDAERTRAHLRGVNDKGGALADVDAFQTAAGHADMAVGSASVAVAADFDLERAAGHMDAVESGVQVVDTRLLGHKPDRVLVLKYFSHFFTLINCMKNEP